MTQGGAYLPPPAPPPPPTMGREGDLGGCADAPNLGVQGEAVFRMTRLQRRFSDFRH